MQSEPPSGYLPPSLIMISRLREMKTGCFFTPPVPRTPPLSYSRQPVCVQFPSLLFQSTGSLFCPSPPVFPDFCVFRPSLHTTEICNAPICLPHRSPRTCSFISTTANSSVHETIFGDRASPSHLSTQPFVLKDSEGLANPSGKAPPPFVRSPLMPAPGFAKSPRCPAPPFVIFFKGGRWISFSQKTPLVA